MSDHETVDEELERLRKFEIQVYLALAQARIRRAGGPGIEVLAAQRDEVLAHREAVGTFADEARARSEAEVPRSARASYEHGLAAGAEAALAILDGRRPSV